MSLNYISYSGYKEDEKCPYAYWLKYIVRTRAVENCINALYGTTIGTVFESFYKQQIWRDKDIVARLLELAPKHLDQAIKEARDKGRDVDWSDETANYHSKEEILVDLKETIPMGVQTIRENRFVGPRMDAEFKLDFKFGKYTIGGRSDFIIQRVKPLNDLVILDGKGSKHRELYVDGHKLAKGQKVEGTQLKWYAMLYKEHTGVIPDGLGYIFWRFGGDRAIEWVEFSEPDLVRLKNEVLSAVKRLDTSTDKLDAAGRGSQAYNDLRQELFPAQPSFGCNLCAYVTICEEGKKQKQKSRPRPRLNLPEGVTELALGIDD
jgi:hypothetical protein